MITPEEFKKLRLLLFEECNRKCVGCCNQDWDLNNLPIETDFSQYDEIILTGGEPLLKPNLVYNTILKIKKESKAKIYLYTANYNFSKIYPLLKLIDGITMTLHNQKDVIPFLHFNLDLATSNLDINHKSLRLNIFKNIIIFSDFYKLVKEIWKVKDSIEWINNCPLPKGEVFKKL